MRDRELVSSRERFPWDVYEKRRRFDFGELFVYLDLDDIAIRFMRWLADFMMGMDGMEGWLFMMV